MRNRTTTRRAYLVAVGAAGLISLAGCSSDETDGSGTEQTDGEPTADSSEQDSEETSISTNGRDYSQIEYDVEVGDELSEALATIEQSTDTSVVDQINTFEVDMVREEIYCTVEDTGVQTLESTEEEREEYDVPEEAEVDTYGIDIEVQCNQDLVAEQATSIAGGIFRGFLTNMSKTFTTLELEN